MRVIKHVCVSAVTVCVMTSEGCDRIRSSLLHSCTSHVIKYVHVDISSISAAVAFLRCLGDY